MKAPCGGNHDPASSRDALRRWSENEKAGLPAMGKPAFDSGGASTQF
jgi:hypothetical protein